MGFQILDDAKAKALKVLGKDADIPKEKVDFNKLMDALQKEHEKFDTIREQLEASMLACENSLSSIENAVKQTKAIYDKAEFGLNPKKPEDAKKIKQAQQIFATALASEEKIISTGTKNLDELDKHVIQLGKYKAPKL